MQAPRVAIFQPINCFAWRRALNRGDGIPSHALCLDPEKATAACNRGGCGARQYTHFPEAPNKAFFGCMLLPNLRERRPSPTVLCGPSGVKRGSSPSIGHLRGTRVPDHISIVLDQTGARRLLNTRAHAQRILQRVWHDTNAAEPFINHICVDDVVARPWRTERPRKNQRRPWLGQRGTHHHRQCRAWTTPPSFWLPQVSCMLSVSSSPQHECIAESSRNWLCDGMTTRCSLQT